MRGYFRFLSFVFIFLVSLSLGKAKVMAQGSIEISSPEETVQSSLSGFDHSAGQANRLESRVPKRSLASFLPVITEGAMDEAIGVDPLFEKELQANPLVNPGVFPYQIDPVSAFVAAAVTLAIQSFRETGQVDMKAVGRLLNSTELYAGVLGSASAAVLRRGLLEGGKAVAQSQLPNLTATLSSSQLMRILGHITNGLTYTVAVGGGFEIFSHFWKLTIADVENVSKVSDLLKMEQKDFKSLMANFLNYLADSRVRKRIYDSVWNHRVLTYEFISMNIGLYMGIFAGDLIAKRIWPGLSAADKLGLKQRMQRYFARTLGGIFGGVVVQFTPSFIKVGVNRQLLGWKISNKRAALDRVIESIQYGLANQLYPATSNSGFGSYLMTQMDLGADIERLSRELDNLNSLYMQQLFVMNEEDQGMMGLQNSFADTLSFLDRVIEDMGGDDWLYVDPAEMSLAEMSEFSQKERELPEDRKYYLRVLSSHRARFESDFHSFSDFMSQLQEIRDNFRQEELTAEFAH